MNQISGANLCFSEGYHIKVKVFADRLIEVKFGFLFLIFVARASRVIFVSNFFVKHSVTTVLFSVNRYLTGVFLLKLDEI